MSTCSGVKACSGCGRQVGCSCQLHYDSKTGRCVCCQCDPDPAFCNRNSVTPSDNVQELLNNLKAPEITITSATAKITHS